MKNKTYLIILLFIFSFSFILNAESYIDDLINIVENSPNDKKGNKVLVFKILNKIKNKTLGGSSIVQKDEIGQVLKDENGGYVFENVNYNIPFLDQDLYLRTLETKKINYISINFFGNYGVNLESYLFTDEEIDNIPLESFHVKYKYDKDVFSQLKFYAINASKGNLFTEDMGSTDPVSFIVLRVFDGENRYNSILMNPENSFYGKKRMECSQEDFDACFSFCTMALYSHLSDSKFDFSAKVFGYDNLMWKDIGLPTHPKKIEAKKEEIAKLLKKGKFQYSNGEFQEAKKTFYYIFHLDNKNKECRAYIKLINEKLKE